MLPCLPLFLCAGLAVVPASPTADALAVAKASGKIKLWNSVRPRARQVANWELSLFFPQRDDGDMQTQMGLRTQADQDRTLKAVAAISIGGVASASLLEGATALPPTLRYGLSAAAMLAPFAVLAAGVALPDELRRLLVALWRLDPRYRKRQIYHEAGHFLVGLLVGLQMDGYNIHGDGAAVQVSTPDPVSWVGACGQAYDQSPREAADALLDALLVLSMAGVAAEVLACGDAEGGIADVAQARAFMQRIAPNARAGQPSRARARVVEDDRIRWATLMALTLLQRHRSSLDAVVEVFEASGTVGAAMNAAEAAAPADDARRQSS